MISAIVLAAGESRRLGQYKQLMDLGRKPFLQHVVDSVGASRADLFAEMMAIRGDIGFRAIFGDHAGEISWLPVDDRGVVTDIDTMDDFERARLTGRSAP